MAQHKTKEEWQAAALKAIKDYKLIFITDIPPMIGLSKAHFYNLELDKVDEIKETLEANRIDIRVGIRKKWYESDNATSQILLYKLTAEDDERKRISTQYTDLTTGGEKIQPVNRFAKMSDEEMAKIGKELANLMTGNTDEDNAPDDSASTPAA